jgi:uracil phosphoribosyltransferase
MKKNIKAKSKSKFSNVELISHPVLQHKLSRLRKKDTGASDFRRLMNEISCLMAYEVTRSLKTKKVVIETPFEKLESSMIDEPLNIVSIQRAGSGMLEGMLQMLPFARVGHIGIYRDKFIKNTVEYYFRIPNGATGQRIVLIDPLLATGDTAVAAIDRLKQYEVGPITFVCILSSPVGIAKLKVFHPDVNIITLSIERELNDKGYLLPGLGDAGDRLFDTV